MIELIMICLLLTALALSAPGFLRRGLKALVVVAVLAALASVGRMLFASIPSVQPASFFIILCGLSLGPGAGLICGLLTALLSGLLTSLGPFTLWQAFFWGLMGLSAVALRRAPWWVLVAFGFAWGFLFGWGMNLWWYSVADVPLTLGAFLLACVKSFSHDLAHALTNAALLAAFSRGSLKLLVRL